MASLKTTNKCMKFEMLKPFFLFFFCISTWTDFHQNAQYSNHICYRIGEYTVCRRVYELFSPEILQQFDSQNSESDSKVVHTYRWQQKLVLLADSNAAQQSDEEHEQRHRQHNAGWHKGQGRLRQVVKVMVGAVHPRADVAQHCCCPLLTTTQAGVNNSILLFTTTLSLMPGVNNSMLLFTTTLSLMSGVNNNNTLTLFPTHA